MIEVDARSLSSKADCTSGELSKAKKRDEQTRAVVVFN